MVVAGTARVRKGNNSNVLNVNEYLHILTEEIHSLENIGDHDLILIEVQCGSYFGEDVIARLEDKYGRT